MIMFHVFSGSSADINQLSVSVGSDVTVSCLFNKQSKVVGWTALTVEWNRWDKHGKKSNVYMLVDGRAHVNRAGSTVDEVKLLKSDASLQLRNVTVGDEGVYTCRIIIPEFYTETTSLEVLGTGLFVSTRISHTHQSGFITDTLLYSSHFSQT